MATAARRLTHRSLGCQVRPRRGPNDILCNAIAVTGRWLLRIIPVRFRNRRECIAMVSQAALLHDASESADRDHHMALRQAR